MIYDYKVEIIVMVTKEFEGGIVKCDRFVYNDAVIPFLVSFFRAVTGQTKAKARKLFNIKA